MFQTGRFPSAVMMIAIFNLKLASGHQFTRELVAATSIPVTVGKVAELSTNTVVTAFANGSGDLELDVWQYNPTANTLARKGTFVSYPLYSAPGVDGVQIGIAVTGATTFITAGVDTTTSQTRVSSWSVDPSGNLHDLADVYSTPSGLQTFNCAITALSSTQVAIMETDFDPNNRYSSLLSVFEVLQGEPIFQNSVSSDINEEQYIALSAVNTGQVVTARANQYGGALDLYSYGIETNGYIFGEHSIVAYSGIGGVAMTSLAPGSFMTAVQGWSSSELVPVFWTVDPTEGTFTGGVSVSQFESGPPTICSVNGVPVTAVGTISSGLRVDAWGNGGPSGPTDLATASDNLIFPSLAVSAVSSTYLVTVFENDDSHLELIFWKYQ